MKRRILALQLVGCGALAIAGCSKKEPDVTASSEAAAIEPSNGSITDALDDANGLQTTSEAIERTGIGGIFAGRGSYTLLAPTDDAFAKLGGPSKQLSESADTAPLAALLKAHILPGYLTVADINAAVVRSAGKAVKMRTMAGQELTFAKAGDALTVSTAEGVTARIVGEAVTGKSSIALPIDTVLKKL